MKYLIIVLMALLLACSTSISVLAQTHTGSTPATNEGDKVIAIAESKALKLQWDRDNYRYERSMQEQSKLFLAKLVVIYYENGVWTKQSGSASLVKSTRNHRNYFLSAEHIFTDDNNKPLVQDFTAILTIGKDRYYFSKKDIYLEPDTDIMIIKAPDNLHTDLVLDEELKLNKGNRVTIFGYPDSDFLASEGIVLYADQDFSLLDGVIYGGSSGGPTVLMGKQKKLTGITTSFANKNMTGVVFVPLQEIVVNIKKFDKLHKLK